MPSFLIRELQLIIVLLLIYHSYMSRTTRFVSLKLCVGFSNFDSVFFFLFLLKFIFFFNKIHGLAITLKRHNSFQNYNNRKATHGFSPRFLIFKLQQVLKSNDICVSCSCSKTDLETNFLNLENQSFEIVGFSQ